MGPSGGVAPSIWATAMPPPRARTQALRAKIVAIFEFISVLRDITGGRVNSTHVSKEAIIYLTS
jgi:hypothetical protein